MCCQLAYKHLSVFQALIWSEKGTKLSSFFANSEPNLFSYTSQSKLLN